MGLFRRREEPSRPPLADLTSSIDVDGRPVALSEVAVGARVDAGRLSVEVHHPSFADLSEEARLQVTEEILVATLGGRGLRQVVHRAAPVTYPPIDSFSLESLRSFARSLGAQVDPEG